MVCWINKVKFTNSHNLCKPHDNNVCIGYRQPKPYTCIKGTPRVLKQYSGLPRANPGGPLKNCFGHCFVHLKLSILPRRGHRKFMKSMWEIMTGAAYPIPKGMRWPISWHGPLMTLFFLSLFNSFSLFVFLSFFLSYFMKISGPFPEYDIFENMDD